MKLAVILIVPPIFSDAILPPDTLNPSFRFAKEF